MRASLRPLSSPTLDTMYPSTQSFVSSAREMSPEPPAWMTLATPGQATVVPTPRVQIDGQAVSR